VCLLAHTGIRTIRLGLPDEPRGDLPNARCFGTSYFAKGAAAEVAGRIVEIRVIEDVEELGPDLNVLGFGDGNVFRHPEIGVDESRKTVAY
jgi:hypothetical protein